MKNQKGFVWLPLLLSILGVLLVGSGVYYVMRPYRTSQTSVNQTVTTAQQTSTSTQMQTTTDGADLCPYHTQDGQVYMGVTPIPGVDPATFVNKSVTRGDWTECIGKDATHVVVQFNAIPRSDASQFQVLPPNGTMQCKYFFRIQGAGVFTGVWQLPGADPKNFVDLTSDDTSATQGTTCYGKDALHVYATSGKPTAIANADPHTFVVLNSNYSKDATHVWYLGGEYDNDGPIPGSDPNTFIALSDEYAKDTSHVYNMDKVITGADPSTFVLLTYGFAKDATHVYAGATALPDIDPNSVVVLDNAWLKDKNHVYATPFLFSTPGYSAYVSQADSSTFVALGLGYGKDSKNVYSTDYYHNSAIVQGADPKTFVVVDTYAKDANHVYDMGAVLKDADVKTFKSLPFGDYATFYIDKSHAWVRGGIGKGGIGEIPGADPNTLVVTGPEEAKDAHHTYSFSAKGYFLIDGAGGPNF